MQSRTPIPTVEDIRLIIKPSVGNRISNCDLEELIDLVSDLFCAKTFGRSTCIHLTDSQLADLFRAYARQIEYWDYIDPDLDMLNATNTLNVDGKTMKYVLQDISPRALRILRTAGFVTCGVSMK